jgi:hypothetical protein
MKREGNAEMKISMFRQNTTDTFGIFQCHNPSGPTINLGWTQRLTEMIKGKGLP